MALTPKQIESRIQYVKDCLQDAEGRVRATHGDQGPVRYAAALKQYKAAGEAKLEMLERALDATTRRDLQQQEVSREKREQQMDVCPSCFCKHPGEC